MPSTNRFVVGFTLAVVAILPSVSHADDTDALALQSADSSAPKDRGFRLFAEGVLGTLEQRGGLGSRSTRRLSIDYSQGFRLGSDWRLNLSNRLDSLDPPGVGVPSTLNSLREAYVAWRPESGDSSVEVGRINVRNGPAYGFNPTDFFRDGALRASTTVDPFALRENRLGTVMVRAQTLWAGGSASVALAPKLANGPSTASFSADFGATNSRDKALGTVSLRLSDRVGVQAIAYTEQGRGAQLGASMTALLTDATVAHLEWTRGRDEDTWKKVTTGLVSRNTQSRLAAGVTYALAHQLALTAEFEYNGFAPTKAQWRQVAGVSPGALGLYVLEAQRRQDNASRNAWLLYATKKSFLLKNLDATALVRLNADDNSRLGWLEVRHHWTGIDAAVQWQWSQGSSATQYGSNPVRQALQLLVGVYF